MDRTYVDRFAVSLMITVLSETITLIIVMRHLFRNKSVPLTRLLPAGILASCATLPYLWFVFPAYIWDYYLFLAVGEISVTAAEALMYRYILNLSMTRACILSLICNSVSFSIGLLYHQLRAA